MANSVIKGRDLLIYANGKCLALSTSSSLEISQDLVEVSSKDAGGGKWTASQGGKLSWSMSSENLFSTEPEGLGYENLFKLMTDQVEVTVVFGLEKTYKNKPNSVPKNGWLPNTSGIYSGKALITSLSLSAPVDDNATYSVELQGVGELTLTPTPATA
jgi:phage major tail protein 2|nr:MAG TPA: major tail protein [Caudoviricetes sp.]